MCLELVLKKSLGNVGGEPRPPTRAQAEISEENKNEATAH
jgi:hypothetical protein